jgi:rod shape-determining protein MreD
VIAVLRGIAIAVLVVLSVTLQVSVFNHFALGGVAPDLALLAVIAAALVRGPEYAAVVGFGAGLVLDLAPPADHTAGRWALSLVLVGYLTGLARSDDDTTVIGRFLMVAAGAFIGTSVFALTGLILRDPGVSVSAALDVVPRAVAYDVLVTPLMLPLLLFAFRRIHPAARWYQRAGSTRRVVPHHAEQW